MPKTGKACEAFGGRIYTLNNFSGPGGTGTNNKDAGVNFYFDWVIKHNNFYNKGIVIPYGEYRLSVHHVLWPVPKMRSRQIPEELSIRISDIREQKTISLP